MMSLDDLSRPWRLLVGFFAANVALGYTTALGYVWSTTRMAPQGIVDRFRGNESDPDAVEIAYAKSFQEMLGLSHSHILAMVVFLFLLGALTLSARRPGPRCRSLLALEPLVAWPVSFGGLWLAWGVHPGFSWLVSVSSGLAALAFYAQFVVVTRACFAPSAREEM